MNELVSVIVPVYNTEKYIRKCIESILGQTYRNIELILVNDGSQQSEELIIKEYIKKDSRICYLQNDKNQGLFLTRIRGVRHAKGKYVMFVDSDDYINIDFIRLLVKKAQESKSDITFARTVLNTEKEKKAIHILQDTILHALPLEGEDIRHAYFEQGGSAYIWHTIWNKLYSKSLWDICLPYFEKLSAHIVMTEDIAFSSVLFYFSNKIDKVENSIYYYCQHSGASTSTKDMNLKIYQSKVNDISKVFHFLEDFYEEKEDYLKDGIQRFKRYYIRLWKNGVLNVCQKDREEAERILNELLPNTESRSSIDDNYFGMEQAPYTNRLEQIKEEIWNTKCKYISFDIFDTLVTRPFYEPTDLFYCLDEIYEKHMDTNTSFYTIRLEGEQALRELICKPGELEDVTLSQIYEYIGRVYGIPSHVCNDIMEREEELEVQFTQRRNTAYELYEVAKLSGKKVIIISDMYLEDRTIKKILYKNGYCDYEKLFVSSKNGKLKGTGNLYKYVMDDLGIKADEILHIGDNQFSDIQMAKEQGIQTIYFPKAMDVFFNRVAGLNTNACATIWEKATGLFKGKKAFEHISGYGCMIAIVANDYFDNPFRPYHPLSDFNMDPYLIGFYLLGMNLIAQIEWLESLKKRQKLETVIFTARDGYLLKKAYDAYLKISNQKVITEYKYTSRKAMLPVILKSKSEFMNLPIVYQRYSPVMIRELLSFCSIEMESCKWDSLCRKNKIEPYKKFTGLYEYHCFMKFYLEHLYDQTKHKEAVRAVSLYWKDIDSDAYIFDLGYSATIHNAIALASGKTPTALFVHTDIDKNRVLSRRGKFGIESMMNSIPNISGLMREHFFSELCGSCQAYEIIKGKSIPVLENEKKEYIDCFPIKSMQEAAIKFVVKFYRTFADLKQYLDIRISDVQMPFEGFLCSPTKLDTKIFSASYFEDKVYGALNKINVRDFWLQLLMGNSGEHVKNMIDNIQETMKGNEKTKLALFGTGKMCKDLMERYKLPVNIFLDNNVQKRGQEWFQSKIFLLEDIKDIKDYYIIIVCGAYIEIEEQLEDIGLEKYKDFTNCMEVF